MASRDEILAELRSKAAGFPPPPRCSCRFQDLAEQLEHALLGLVGQRQRGHRDRLAGGEGPAVRRFLFGVGQRQVGRAGLQHVDQVLREVLTDLHDREVRTEGRSLGPERAAGCAEDAKSLVCRSVVQEVRPARQLKVTPLQGRNAEPGAPFNRLMPMKEASREVVLIWLTTSLNCLTRLLRTVCEDGSLTGIVGVKFEKVLPTPVAEPLTPPIKADAASLVVTMVITPVGERLACRLLLASALFRSFKLLT